MRQDVIAETVRNIREAPLAADMWRLRDKNFDNVVAHYDLVLGNTPKLHFVQMDCGFDLYEEEGYEEKIITPEILVQFANEINAVKAQVGDVTSRIYQGDSIYCQYTIQIPCPEEMIQQAVDFLAVAAPLHTRRMTYYDTASAHQRRGEALPTKQQKAEAAEAFLMQKQKIKEVFPELEIDNPYMDRSMKKVLETYAQEGGDFARHVQEVEAQYQALRQQLGMGAGVAAPRPQLFGAPPADLFRPFRAPPRPVPAPIEPEPPVFVGWDEPERPF